jgi:hypothetical protein
MLNRKKIWMFSMHEAITLKMQFKLDFFFGRTLKLKNFNKSFMDRENKKIII